MAEEQKRTSKITPLYFRIFILLAAVDVVLGALPPHAGFPLRSRIGYGAIGGVVTGIFIYLLERFDRKNMSVSLPALMLAGVAGSICGNLAAGLFFFN